MCGYVPQRSFSDKPFRASAALTLSQLHRRLIQPPSAAAAVYYSVKRERERGPSFATGALLLPCTCDSHHNALRSGV